MYREDELKSSRNMNEFNRGEEGKGLLFRETLLHRLTSWFIYLCPLIFFLILVIFSICIVSITYSPHDDSVPSALRVFKTLKENRDKIPFQKIKSISSTEDATTHVVPSCDDGWETYIFYKWPGTNSGCLCSDSSTAHNTAYCWFHRDCKSISSTNSKDADIWKEHKICALRYDSNKFSFVEASETCKTGFKKCQSTICVENSLDCPVTDITTIETSATAVRVNTDHALVDLRATITNPPCLDYLKYGKTSSEKYYPLLKTPLNGCGDYGDLKDFTKKLNEESQTDLYKQNKIEDIVKNLGYWKDYQSDSDKFNIYSVRRIDIAEDASCQNIHRKLGSLSSYSETTIHSIIVISSINLALGSIGLLLAIGYVFCRNLRIGKRYPLASIIIPYILVFIAFVTVILCIVQCSIYWKNDSNIEIEGEKETYIQKVLDNNCFGQKQGFIKAAKAIRDYFDDSNTDVYGLILFLFIWAILWLVFWIAAYIVRRGVLRDAVFRRPK